VLTCSNGRQYRECRIIADCSVGRQGAAIVRADREVNWEIVVRIRPHDKCTIVIKRTVVPLLGESWAPDQEGFGSVRPSVAFNGGDPTGLFEDLVWDNWGDPTADGHGTAIHEDGNVDVADSPREPASFRAYDLGTCQGHLVYLHLAVWFPQHGETFDPATNGETSYRLCPS
jgi:hypothetical protein